METTTDQPMDQVIQVAEQLNTYGGLLINGLYFLIGGLLVVYVVNRLVTRFVYPHIQNPRILKVVFGTTYVLVLVVTVLLILNNRGFETENFAQLALLVVVLGGVGIFFLLPFFPKLPFKIGHMVELNGTLGIVDTITPFHTHLRTFDGKMVFIPNALVMATKIINYHHTPDRRIELNLRITNSSDLARTKKIVQQIMVADEHVLNEPSPLVLVVDASAAGTDLTAYCWVKNADWLGVRSELWSTMIAAIENDAAVNLSLPVQEVIVSK